MIKSKTALLIIILLTGINSYAQFKLSAEYRPRFEFRDGFKTLPPEYGQTPAYQFSQRTRLNVGFKWNIINTYLSIQDYRLWGDEPLKKDVAGLGLYQGWVEIKACDSLFIKAGRQEFYYDYGRLLDNGGFNQKGTVHDALLLKYNHQGFSADMGVAYNQSKDTVNSTDYNTTLGNYKALGFLWLKYDIRNFGIQAFLIADGYQNKLTRNTMYVRATHGGVLSYTSKYISADARGAIQFGQDETGKFINAYYANIDITAKPLKFLNIVTGLDFLTGNDQTKTPDNRVRYFTPLYGSGHRFNGNMEYFSRPTGTKNCGLIDVYLALVFKIKQKYQLRADVHYFRLENKYAINGTVQKPYLGTEADITAKIPIINDVDVQIGYSAMFASNTLANIQGGGKKNFGHWAYVMLCVKPTIFTHEVEKNK